MKKIRWEWWFILAAIILLPLISGCEFRLDNQELPLSKETSIDNGCAKMCVLVDGAGGIKEKRYIRVEKLSVYFSNTKEQSYTTIKIGDALIEGTVFESSTYQWAEIIVPAGTDDRAEWEKWINENHLQRPEPQLIFQRVLPPKPLSPEKEENKEE